MEDKDKLIQGFNNAYLLISKKPELAVKIADGLEKLSDEYSKGFIEGCLRGIMDYKLDIENIRNILDESNVQRDRSKEI